MSENSNDRNPIWRFEPLTDFEPPTPPAKATLRKKLGLFLKRILPSKKKGGEREDLESPTDELLDRTAPAPPREPFMKALDEAVDRWLKRQNRSSQVLVFVLATGDELDSLGEWARTRDAECIPSPDPDSILAGALETLPSFAGDGLLVLPQLELWLRRHHNSLRLIRELIGRLHRSKRPCVVGMNSWAWSYLNRAADISVELPTPLTLAPFEAPVLSEWLSGLAEENVVVRSDDNGEVVLDPAKDGSVARKSVNGNGNGHVRGDFMLVLAAASRGHPWLAWHLFRHSMQVRPKNGSVSPNHDPGRTVWVSQKFSLELPEMEKRERAAALLVFHALLIHGELTLSELETVLPPIRTLHVVHKLATGKILVSRKGKWSVALVAYPAVREALVHDGFPVDQL